jgi:hypothetical protein
LDSDIQSPCPWEVHTNQRFNPGTKTRYTALASSLVHAAIILLLCLSCCAPRSAPQENPLKVSIDWKQIVSVSKTTASLQVVVNPPLRRGSKIHDPAWAALKNMNADYVRFVPWLPYPRLGVAELAPPAPNETSWDFSLIDPLVSDFFDAMGGHPVMLNFSTIPQWMFRTDSPVAFPSNPDEVIWNYSQGKTLRDPSAKEVAEYYARLANWYSHGGFVDENGKTHSSSFHHKIDLWEVLNEVDYEHTMSPETYTLIYDAITESVHKVLPDTKFVSLALAEPSNRPDFFEYFLDPRHHKPGTPLDFISYHFYATPTDGQTPAVHQYTFFDQADKFLSSVRFIEAIRSRLSPNTKTAINEVGCILPDDNNPNPRPIPESYWNLCGATYAHLYISLVRQGIDIFSSSQLVGYPTQFPSVTLLDWKTGQPNARYWVLKLIRDNFGPEDQLVETKLDSPNVDAQAFITARGTHKLLLVNKREHSMELQIPGLAGARETHVDLKSGAMAPSPCSVNSNALVLGPYSVLVLDLPQ